MADAYLAHHGIKGQKWGVRRYQNADGTYTAAGKKRHDKNQQYITGIVDANNQVIKSIQANQANSRKIADSLRRQGVKKSMADGFEKEYAQKGVDILANREDRRIKLGYQKMDTILRANKRISEIDPGAQSFRKTKKLVNKIISDATTELRQHDEAYDASKEVQAYNNAKYNGIG